MAFLTRHATKRRATSDSSKKDAPPPPPSSHPSASSSRPLSFSSTPSQPAYPGSLTRRASASPYPTSTAPSSTSSMPHIRSLRAKWFPGSSHSTGHTPPPSFISSPLPTVMDSTGEDDVPRPTEIGTLLNDRSSTSSAPTLPTLPSLPSLPSPQKVVARPGLRLSPTAPPLSRGGSLSSSTVGRGPRVVKVGSLDALSELGIGVPVNPSSLGRPTSPGSGIGAGGSRGEGVRGSEDGGSCSDAASARSGMSWRPNGSTSAAPFTTFSTIVSTSPAALSPRPMSPISSPYATRTPFLTTTNNIPPPPAAAMGTGMQPFRLDPAPRDGEKAAIMSVDEALASGAATTAAPADPVDPRSPAARSSILPPAPSRPLSVTQNEIPQVPEPLSPRTPGRRLSEAEGTVPAGLLSPRTPLPPRSPPPTGPLPEVPSPPTPPTTVEEATSTTTTGDEASPATVEQGSTAEKGKEGEAEGGKGRRSRRASQRSAGSSLTRRNSGSTLRRPTHTRASSTSVSTSNSTSTSASAGLGFGARVTPPMRKSSIPKSLRNRDREGRRMGRAIGAGGGVEVGWPEPREGEGEKGVSTEDGDDEGGDAGGNRRRRSRRVRRKRVSGTDETLAEGEKRTTPAPQPMVIDTALPRDAATQMRSPHSAGSATAPGRPETVLSFTTAKEERSSLSSDDTARSRPAVAAGTDPVFPPTSFATYIATPRGGAASSSEDDAGKLGQRMKMQRSRSALAALKNLADPDGSVIRPRSGAGVSSPVLVRSSSSESESVGCILSSDVDVDAEAERPWVEEPGAVGDAAESSADASTTLGYLREGSPEYPEITIANPELPTVPADATVPFRRPKASDESTIAAPTGFSSDADADDEGLKRQFVCSPLSYLIQSMGGHVPTPPATVVESGGGAGGGMSPREEVWDEPEGEAVAAGTLLSDAAEGEESGKGGVGERAEEELVIESVLEDAGQVEEHKLASSTPSVVHESVVADEEREEKASAVGLGPPPPSFKRGPTPPAGGEVTPTTSKRWSINEIEEAYGRMRDLIGSRSGSLSVVSNSGDELSDISHAYEKALASAEENMIDIEKLDPALQVLLTPNSLSNSLFTSKPSSPAASSSPEVQRTPLAESTSASDDARSESPVVPKEIPGLSPSTSPRVRARRNTLHDQPSLEEVRSPPKTPPKGPLMSPRKAGAGSADLGLGSPVRRATFTQRAYSDGRRDSNDTTAEAGWTTPMSTVSPHRRSASATVPSPARQPSRSSRTTPLPVKTMRSAAGRQWAQEALDEQSTSSQSEIGSVAEGSAMRRSQGPSDGGTHSTKATSRSKYTGTPSPPLDGAFQTGSSRRSVSGLEAPLRAGKPRISSWYDEDTPRKPSPVVGRSESSFSRLGHAMRDGSDLDLDLIARSPTPGYSQRLGSISDARSMTKVDIFLLATKLQAELETVQKQAHLERDALLDALQESRAVVNDLRAQRDALQSNRTSAALIREIAALKEERDEWRRRAEDAGEAIHMKEEEIAALLGALQETRTRQEKVQLENGRLQNKANALANELKRAVVDLRSASSLSVNSLGSNQPRDRSDAGSISSGFKFHGGFPHRSHSTRSASGLGKERTPSLASNGPAYDAVGETPIASTTFQFAPDSGVTPSAMRGGLPLPVPHRPNGLHSYIAQQRGSHNSSPADEGEDADEPHDNGGAHTPLSPIEDVKNPQAAEHASPSLRPSAASLRQRRGTPGSPTSSSFTDLRLSIGSVPSSMRLTSDDEKFLADLEVMSNLADGSLDGDFLMA